MLIAVFAHSAPAGGHLDESTACCRSMVRAADPSVFPDSVPALPVHQGFSVSDMRTDAVHVTSLTAMPFHLPPVLLCLLI